MYQDKQVYHIFKVCIGKQYYRIERTFTDEEFDRVMDLVHWRMPFNICVYHFLSSDPPVCTNPVINALPVIDYSIEKLFSEPVRGELKVRDKDRKLCRTVYKKWEHLVIVQDDIGDGEYGKLLPLDGSHVLVSNLEPFPITLKDAQKYVQKYHRHNDAPYGHKFSIALFSDSEEEPVGVVIASIPKSRILAKTVILWKSIDAVQIPIMKMFAVNYILWRSKPGKIWDTVNLSPIPWKRNREPA